MSALRLSHQLFLVFGLMIVVVALLDGWNLLATDRLASENRAIVGEALPAVRLEVMLLENVSALRRLEGRYGVLRDRAYLTLFQERVRSMEADSLRLEALLSTTQEREALGLVGARLAEYSALVERRPMSSPVDASPAVQLEASLQQLYDRSDAVLRRRAVTAQALNESSRLIALLGLAAGVLLGLSVAVFAVFRIARPLRRLQAATSEVARRDFSEPIAVRGRDEVADLTRAFNQMAAKLRELDELKEEFFAAISHDLRTPLTAIRLSAELFQRDATGPLSARQTRLVEQIRTSSERLIALVNQLLDLGSLKAGRLQLELRQTDLRHVVAGSLEEVRPLAEQRKLQMDVTIPEALPRLLVDARRIQQVLVNLLGNSVKFTQEGGRVSTSAELETGEVVVKVRDTGIGIPPHLMPKIFELYHQAHKGHGGTGIGLTVVKGLVEAHGGRVWAESQPGRGSCFAFTLPLERRAG